MEPVAEAPRRGTGGVGRAVILAPVAAWLAAAVAAFFWFNDRGHWKTAIGPEGYEDCFGTEPPAHLSLLACEAKRHYRYTGELLARECYVRAKGDFDTTGAEWRAAPRLREDEMDSVLAAQGLTRPPDWFRPDAGPARAKALRSREGRVLSLYPVGEGEILIAGSWVTRAAR